jgi:hypothetical protein
MRIAADIPLRTDEEVLEEVYSDMEHKSSLSFKLPFLITYKYEKSAKGMNFFELNKKVPERRWGHLRNLDAVKDIAEVTLGTSTRLSTLNLYGYKESKQLIEDWISRTCSMPVEFENVIKTMNQKENDGLGGFELEL